MSRARITEAELRDIEANDSFAEDEFGKRFIAEVRRLRGLIFGVATIRPGDHAPPYDDPGVRCPLYDDCLCPWCESQSGHAPTCPWPALEAEAMAVAGEAGPTK